MKRKIMCLCILLIVPAAMKAQEQPKDETAAKLKLLEERLQAVEAELAALKAAKLAEAPAAPVAAPAPSYAAAPMGGGIGPQTGVSIGGNPGAAKALNPDISLIGDFLGAFGKNPIRPVPGLEMHESELGLQAIIDPYARADVFISFGETGVNVEEAFLTFTSLPGGFVAKAGKFRSAFGKVNTIHNHALEWTDRPLVTENLIGGEDGINDAGFSVTRILPAPKGIFLEGTAQVFRGDSADVFKTTRHGDRSVVGHLRGYGDLSESTNLDLGFSYARGYNDAAPGFITQLYGMDATLRWKPLRRAIYHSFLFRTEAVWSDREQLLATQKAFGLFSSAEYRLNRRWTVAGRFDRSERATDASMRDNGFSALLTYWPSEFSQIRGQYRFSRYAEGRDANEFRLQILFVMGAHGAHPF